MKRFKVIQKLRSFSKPMVVCVFMLWICTSQANANPGLSTEIRVNQVGYLLGQVKRAVVHIDANEFIIKDNKSQETVFSGSLSKPRFWPFSGESVRVAEFTELNRPGTYRLYVGRSYSHCFEIKANLYCDLLEGAFKFYYYNRASTALPEKHAGQWHRPHAHPDTRVEIHASAASASRPEGAIISCPKGWYDAGDYNKYVVNSGITTYSLMALYEAYPDYIKGISTNIPESDNNVPDLLDEVRWNLEWLSTMQDPEDGGVYHKMTCPRFGGAEMPHLDKQKRVVVQKTTTAALNFCAVMAQAARVFESYDSEFASSCLQQAKRAWAWAQKHPYIMYKQPKDIQTGAYGDYSVVDEFAWAATELYITTLDDNYFKQSNLLYLQLQVQIWDQTSPLGFLSLVHNRHRLTSIVDMDRIEQRVTAYAKFLRWFYDRSAYHTSNERFEWGSNAFFMNEAMIQLVAYHLTKDKQYLEVALGNLDYILGKNPLGKCYVTGFGSNPPRHVHHRVSSSDGVDDPIPGMLVGGPNPEDTHDCGPEAYPSALPALSYADKRCSYSTNEVAINWNAALSYVVGSICAVDQQSQK